MDGLEEVRRRMLDAKTEQGRRRVLDEAAGWLRRRLGVLPVREAGRQEPPSP